MDAVAADFERSDHAGFVVEPFRPALLHGFFVEVGFGEFYKEVIVPGLALHKTAVELAEVRIFEPFAKPFEAFAATGFDQREDEEPVEKALFLAAAFALEFHQFVYVLVFALASQLQASFL